MARGSGAAGGQSQLERFAVTLGHAFGDISLLTEALTHPSLAGTAAGRGRSGRAYERLEFLGDRVLSLVIAAWLFDRYPDDREGDLAKRLAGLVQRETLADVARSIGLGAQLRLAPGEADGGGRDNPTILSDALEAVIGAVFCDGGLEAARTLVHALWADRLVEGAAAPQDPKTRLQEWAQGRGLPTPDYLVVSQTGPPHDPRFTVEAAIPGIGSATATGTSKRAAEKSAAAALLAQVEPRAERGARLPDLGRTGT